jgi:hypothetical protein
MRTWLDEHGIDDVNSVRNWAHREPAYDTAPTGAPVPSAH